MGNRTERYRGVGESGGMLAGGAIGAVLGSALGPVGTVAGGYLGSMAGETIGGKVGEWTKTLVDADIPGMIGKAWTGFVADAKSGWEKVVAGASEAWGFAKDKGKEALEAAKNAANKANDTVKAATGVDVKSLAKEGAAKAVEVGGKAADVAKDAAVKTGDFVAENAPKLVPNTVKRLAGMAGNAASLASEAISSGITDPRKLALFMGQMAHESGGFGSLSENLNYSSMDRIRAVFGKNKAIAGMSDDQLQGLVRNPDALANAVYGNRMGNTEPGDGAKYKGRGFVQLTGKDNYTAASKALGIDLVKNPELASDPDTANKIAVWYWKSRVEAKGADSSIEASTKAINGGFNGMDDRKAQTAKYASLFSGGIAAQGGATVAAGSTSFHPPTWMDRRRRICLRARRHQPAEPPKVAPA